MYVCVCVFLQVQAKLDELKTVHDNLQNEHTNLKVE